MVAFAEWYRPRGGIFQPETTWVGKWAESGPLVEVVANAGVQVAA